MAVLVPLLGLISTDALLVARVAAPGLLLVLACIGALGRLRTWAENQRVRRQAADRYMGPALTGRPGVLEAVAAALLLGAVVGLLRRAGDRGNRAPLLRPDFGQRLGRRGNFRANTRAAVREGPCGPVGAPCWLTGRIDCDGRHDR